jgi:hypothetical protein
VQNITQVVEAPHDQEETNKVVEAAVKKEVAKTVASSVEAAVKRALATTTTPPPPPPTTTEAPTTTPPAWGSPEYAAINKQPTPTGRDDSSDLPVNALIEKAEEKVGFVPFIPWGLLRSHNHKK